ncbi:MAG: hypothetical protein HY530_00535 [Chloroflexi bacterium]|nr:hypothetical protein [Chloroflexota bacterium]
MEEAEVTRLGHEARELAAKRARERARIARWDLDVAVFLFAVLIIVIILLFQGIATEVVTPIAIFGLVMVWLVGWRRGRQLYQSFLQEELARLEAADKKAAESIEETIEEKVQKALRERLR